ncbi:AAA domain-containing protein [Shimazuella sp. AN120528]|uniref:AAA domain-containing protein n=1 Tax=Shimazuella soli TaxID=1892854 RepID=UPI001F0D577D|nr:AAA domain-containing protein [Shimazuella soli]MCH5586008.1 AAA domain-containing protein [Shimazuella soli]
MDPIRERVIRLFQYLKETKSLQEKIVRTVEEYETVWWQSDLMGMSGVDIYDIYSNDEVWMSVERPHLSEAPTPPSKLLGWISDWKQPDKKPKPIASKGKKEFEKDTERVELLENWLNDEWKPWAGEVASKYKVKRVYDELFSLYNRLQAEGDSIEIVWGHGLLNWEIGDVRISRHLIVTPLELHFYPEKGEFRLASTSKGSYMETDMLTSTSFTHTNQIHELVQEQGGLYSPRQEDEISPVLQRVVHVISPDGRYSSEIGPVNKATERPFVTYSPAVFIRRKGALAWDQELRDVLDRLQEGYPISRVLSRLVWLEDEDLFTFEREQEEDHILSEHLLFPLPANQQQKDIVEKLNHEDGVVVQGPPGTGKSHTIANLICHLLAQGKRVLVTSEKERVLDVLRGKIPQEIRSLCVSLLGGDAKSVKELETSIRSISEQLSTKQLSDLEQNINEFNQELRNVRNKINDIEEQMSKIAMMDNQTKEVDGEKWTPLSAAKWLHQNREHNWLPDSISPDVVLPMSGQEVQDLVEGLSHFKAEDRISLTSVRPELSQLPNPINFAALMQELQVVEQSVEQNRVFYQEWNISGSVAHLLPPATRVVEEAILELQEIYRDAWQMNILQQTKEEHDWPELIEEFRDRLSWISAYDKALLEFDVELPIGKSTATIKQDVAYVLERMKQMKRTGRVFRRITGRQYSYLFKECTINGKVAKEREDFEIIQDYIERNDLRNRVVLKWNRLMEDINGPMVEATTPRLVHLLTECLEQIEYLLAWPSRVEQQLSPIVEKLGVPQVDYVRIEWYEDFIHALQALQDYFQWEKLNQNFKQLHHILVTGRDSEYAHPYWNDLLMALQEADTDRWEQIYSDLERLESLQTVYSRFQEKYEQLRKFAPQLVSKMEQEENYPYANFAEAWKWSQLKHWLNQFAPTNDLDSLEKELHKHQDREAFIIRQLVADATWKERLEKTTEREKRSLISWLQLIKRIGTSSDKQLDLYRKQANEELNVCRGAIPVWIMPIQRVIENIKLDDDRFDVVIVDESSQSNLYALSALLRGKKAVIVGDDGQIVPDMVEFDRELNMELIKRYLYDIPQSGHLDISTSLYDTANRIIHNKVILKEHFRSVPDIIQFSNQLSYDNEMIPLRLPSLQDNLTPSIVTVPVQVDNPKENAKGLNEPEAIAVVEQILKCCNDERYANKTFGVISLAGGEQAKLIEDRLRMELGELEMMRRHIICGDPYRFQGDERDIIFLSLGVLPGVKPKALTSDADRRQFTVATSRARDQIFLFHSVELTGLSPDDIRFSLLKYSQSITSGQNTEAIEEDKLFASQLEQDVYQYIVDKGYNVSVKVQIGIGKSLDIVIEGEKTRLAVECDGDKLLSMEQWKQEFERQSLLERVGWHFHRIRGSYFYQDPEPAMQAVWEKCRELHIFPKQSSDSRELEKV